MYPIKQSTAITVPIFAHDAAGDGVTGLVDGGFTKRISKNGGAFAAMTVTVTELENGWYSVPLSTAHTDTLGLLSVSLSHASCKRINLQFRVHAALPDDIAAFVDTEVASILAAVDTEVEAIKTKTDFLPSATAGAAGGLFIAGTNAATTITTALTTTFTGNLTGSVASVTAGVTLAASAVQAIWDALTSALTTAGSIGKLLVDNIDAAISSRLATAGYTAPPSANDVRDAILSDATPFAGGNINATISSRATPAQVNTEVLDVLTVDTFTEIAAVPAATSTLKDKLNWLFGLARNKITQTATTQTLRNDADDATIATSTVSDDGTTFTKGQFS